MPTHVGVLTIRLYIADGLTLKDKRQVVKGLLDRLRHRHHLSAAEVGLNESHRSAEIAVACVANDASFVRRVLDEALRTVNSEPRAVVEEFDVEML